MHTAREKYSGEKKQFLVRKLVWAQQSDDPEKIIVLEEIVWREEHRIELRLAYYTTSKTGPWWWGQFAIMIPKKDLEELLRRLK